MSHVSNNDIDSGAAEPLTASDTLTEGRVTFKASRSNSGVVYVAWNGTAASSTNGVQLSAGEQITTLVRNLKNVSVRASANDQGLSAHWPT